MRWEVLEPKGHQQQKEKKKKVVAQSCPTLCDPIDSSPPGSPVPGILQPRTLERLLFLSPMHEREVAQSCRTLHDPMGCSLPCSSVHGIFQARVLKWGAIAFSDSLTRYVKKFSLMLILFNRTAIHEVVFSSYIPWFYQSLLRSKNLQAINAGEGVEKREPSYTVGGNAN